MLEIARIAVPDSPEAGAFWSAMLRGAVGHFTLATGQRGKLAVGQLLRVIRGAKRPSYPY